MQNPYNYLAPRKNKQIKIGQILTSETELKDLLKAWLAISIAFSILLNNGFALSSKFYYLFILSSLTVGVAFMFHELAHKITAQKYGCFAEFRSFDQMLLLAVMMSFFGFIFAAPGAVMISGPVGKRRNGMISMAGPATNLVLALAFLSILFIPPTGLLVPIAFYGFMINSWIALFNLIPIGNFDGKKILDWNKSAYFAMVALSLFLVFGRGLI